METDEPEADQRQFSKSRALDFLLDHIPDVIFFKDRECRFLRVNKALLQLFGLSSQDEIVGKTDFDFLQPEDARRTQEDERHVLATGEAIVGRVTEKHRADGSRWWAFTTKLPLENAAGEIVGTCGISRDITELKQAEEALARSNSDLQGALARLKSAQEQLIEAGRARTVARLAAGVAHEVRNPLAILSMGLDFLSSQDVAHENSERSTIFEEMRDALGRADRVIRTLMEASSPSGLKLERTAVNDVVNQALSSVAGPFEGAGIKVVEDFATDLPEVKADAEKLAKVIEGLLINALEAMPDGGVVEIRTRKQAVQAGDVTRDAGARGGQSSRISDQIIRIDVEDGGCGIPEAAAPRIFDPFFSTKETGTKQGLGMGLTVSRAILELHGGSLQVMNRTDAPGARATIKLKVADSENVRAQ